MQLDQAVSDTLDYLGARSPINLAPAGPLSPVQSIGGAAPAAPGGTGAATGGTGGAGGRGGGGTGGVVQSGSSEALGLGEFASAAGTAAKVLGAIPQTPEPTRGDTGGQSLSDQVRSQQIPVVTDVPEGTFQPPPDYTPPTAADLGAGAKPPLPSDVIEPPPATVPPGPDLSSTAGEIGEGANVAGAAGAVLAEIGAAIGNKDVQEAGQALSQASSVAGTAAAAAGAQAAVEAGTEIGTTATIGLAAAPVTLGMLAGSIYEQISGEKSGLFGARNDYPGVSKVRGEKRALARNLFDASDTQMRDALQAAQDAQARGETDPAALRKIGDALMAGEVSYYKPQTIRGDVMGPSSYAGDTRDFTEGMKRWLGLDAYLRGQGQPGLAVDPKLVRATGLLQQGPLNAADIASHWVQTDTGEFIPVGGPPPAPDWGPMGPPPVDWAGRGSGPAYDAWVNAALRRYEQLGGMQFTPYAPGPAAPSVPPAIAALAPPPAAPVLPGPLDVSALAPPGMAFASGLDKNVMPEAA